MDAYGILRAAEAERKGIEERWAKADEQHKQETETLQARIRALEAQAARDARELAVLRPLGDAAVTVGYNRFSACWWDWQDSPNRVVRNDAGIWPPLIEATKAYCDYRDAALAEEGE